MMDQTQPNQYWKNPGYGGGATPQTNDEVRVEDLPLEKKLEVLKRYNPSDYYKEGCYIDAQDTVNSWCLAQIVETRDKNLSIHYDGWSPKWDVWYKSNSYKVAPFRRQSRFYTGQNKVALRQSMRFSMDDLHNEKLKVEKLIDSELSGLGAFQTTQYLRGTLYIFVDFLMGVNNYTDEQVDAINDFLQAVLRLIIAWLKKVLKLMPLFSQLKVNPDLFLIDENLALLMCYPELMDILKKIFAQCHRCIRYYLFFDKNTIQYDKPVTNFYGNVNFEQARKKDDEDNDVDEIKEQIQSKRNLVFGQFINFINYFAQFGGFEALLDVLGAGSDTEDKIPLDWIYSLTAPFRNCNEIFSQSFASSFVENIKNIIFQRIQNMTEKELKELDKEVVGRLLVEVKDFLSLSYSDSQVAEMIERNQLFIALRFLKSTYLEKRLKGLNDLKHLIDRIELGLRQSSRQFNEGQRRNMDQDMMNIVQGKLKTPKWLTPEILKNWLIEQKILETVFGENTHLEIVKRAGSILKFLAGQNALPEESIELIWKCQLDKHEEMVRVVYNIIKDLVPFINLHYVDLFYAKIKTVPPQQYDEKFLNFLKDFTQKALENYFIYKSKEANLGDNQSDDYEAYEELCFKKERMIIQHLSDNLKSPQKGIEGEEKLYGLPIFWNMIQDTPIQSKDKDVYMSDAKSLETLELASNSLLEILKKQSSKHIRMFYLISALQNLQKGESIVQSIMVAGCVINEFPEMEYSQQFLTQPFLLKQLQMQLGIVNILIKNIVNYIEQVKEKMKQITEKKKQIPEDVSNMVFIGKNTHANSLNQMLGFLEFLIVNSNQSVELGTENINTLWKIFVLHPNFNSDQDLFLKWINKPRETIYLRPDSSLFTEIEKKYFFVKILCNPTYVDFQRISIGEVKCFHQYFKIINVQENNIQYERKKLRVINFQELIGLNTLWSIAIESENQKVREESMDLLVDLHLKFDQQIEIQVQQRVWQEFIDKCMKNLENQNMSIVQNTIQLIIKFLDRYDGIKALKPELKLHQACNFQPFTVMVVNKNDFNQRKQIQISFSQTVGHLRHKIAEAFNFQNNEFLLQIKNVIIDPDEDDDKYFKDVGSVQQVTIYKNPNYESSAHPKYLISGKQENFDRLFYLLSLDIASLTELTWSLLLKIPLSAKLQKEIEELSGVMEDKENWSKILDPKSTHKLFYSLRIIDNYLINRKEKKTQWRFKFVSTGGFSHLLNTFINMNIKNIDTFLTLKCIDKLASVLLEYISFDKKLMEEILAQKEKFVAKCMQMIDLITDFTINQEKKRNESLEDIQKRISQSQQKKNKYKSYMIGNKGQDKNQQDDDDDNDNKDSTLIQTISQQLKEENSIVQNIFNVLYNSLFVQDTSSIVLVPQYPNIEQMLLKSTLKTENMHLRDEVMKKMKDFIRVRSGQRLSPQIINLIQIFLTKVLPEADKFEMRCSNFFGGLCQALEPLTQQDLAPLQKLIENLIYSLADQILKREIKERNTQDQDQLLGGKMQLLKVLLQKFPQQKLDIGKILLRHLLHDCLFEVPQGSKSIHKLAPPKCKSLPLRKVTVQLVSVLCRDCLLNLKEVLQFMNQFNENSSWRTNKTHDWNIALQESEKSSTGYVGIKNLGCICYMLSLFQQLFMIPSFRNDVLSVRDPTMYETDKDDNMLYQLQLLFAGLLKSEKQYVNPKGFCNAFKDWEGQPTNVLEQMDVEEFFNMFMDRLETAIKGTPQQRTIQEHFGGKYASEMICKGCPHTYERQEPFLSLSIPVKNKKSLIEGLNANIQGDMLEGENAYYCEKCDKKVDTLKRTCIKKLPKYLIMTLKRFEYDFDKMIRVKVNDFFEFPMELNMLDFTQEGLKRKEKIQKMKEEKGEDEIIEEEPLKYPKEYYEYKLTGIVVHTGTADSGHYYSFIQDREHPESGKWCEMNDHNVTEFDPNEIAQECFGGEETFQGYNMIQMKSMKWRNAYILLYERKVAVDIPSDEEEDSKQSKEIINPDVNMKELSILEEIQQKIAYENQKYWQNRFLFSIEYNEFVYDIATYWNTSCIIPKTTLNKNDDFHIVNLAKPVEYEKDDTIQDPIDEKMPLSQQFQPQIEQFELEVFKFAAQFYITILQRSYTKSNLSQMINLLKSYLNKNIECCRWLISEFSNFEILEETLLQTQQKEMRKFQSGLIYCAMLKLYQVEKNRLNAYWQHGLTQQTQTILGNFMLIMIRKLPELFKFTRTNHQYFQLYARFASLGPEAREFFLKARMVGRLMDFFFDEASPYKQEFRVMDDIKYQLKQMPDIGLPTIIDRKQISQYQEALENKRLKSIAEDPPKYKYLFETVSLLIRSCKFSNQQTNYQLDDLNYEGLTQSEKTLFSPEARFLKKVFYHAKRNRSINQLCLAYLHYTWQNENNQNPNSDSSHELLKTAIQGLNDYDYDEVRPFYILIQYLIQFPATNFQQRLDMVLSNLLEVLKQNQVYYKFMETGFEFIFKITSINPYVRQWFQEKKQQWEWLIQWVQNYKIPPNPIAQNSPIKLFKKKNQFNQMQMHNQMFKQDQFKSLIMTNYRIKRLQLMLDNQIPDLSNEFDLDIIDLQDFKFKTGDFIDYYQRKKDVAQTLQVDFALDEMLLFKQQYYQQQNDGSCPPWLFCDTDKLVYGHLFKNLYRTKLLDNIQNQMEKKRQSENQQSQHQMMRQGGGSSNYTYQHQDDEDDEMDNQKSGRIQNDSDDDDQQNMYS